MSAGGAVLVRASRHVGWCPVCQKDYKTPGGLLAHHGYRRPGFGHIVGDCLGAREAPHELSPGLAQKYLAMLVRSIGVEEKRQAMLTDPALDEIAVPDYGRSREGWKTIRRDEVAALKWRDVLESERKRSEYAVKQLRREAERTERLVAEWESRPLRTIDEEVRRSTEKKQEREERVRRQRDERLAKLVASYQKRVDSAFRRRDGAGPAVLADLFEGIVRNLPNAAGRTHDRVHDVARALELVARAEVWRSIGLLVGERDYVLPQTDEWCRKVREFDAQRYARSRSS